MVRSRYAGSLHWPLDNWKNVHDAYCQIYTDKHIFYDFQKSVYNYEKKQATDML